MSEEYDEEYDVEYDEYNFLNGTVETCSSCGHEIRNEICANPNCIFSAD